MLDEIAKLKGGAPKSEVKPQQASLVETVLKQSRRALICENDVNLQEEIGHGFFSKGFSLYLRYFDHFSIQGHLERSRSSN